MFYRILNKVLIRGRIIYYWHVKITGTYRTIASLLCFSILTGISLPTGLHAKSTEVCDDTETMHADHQMPVTTPAGHDDCPMEDQNRTAQNHYSVVELGMHDFGFACACSIEEAPVKTEAPVIQKVNPQVLVIVQVLKEDHTNETESDNHAILTSDSYSPPPIFLANESFLI